MTPSTAQLAGVAAVFLPALVAIALGVRAFLAEGLSEKAAHRPVVLGLLGSLVGVVTLSVLAIQSREGIVEVPLGTWFATREHSFDVALHADLLSLTLAATSAIIVLLVAHFAIRYLHRERGYARFFALLALFASGFQLLVLAGSYDVLLLGWETVGLTSVFLVAFFHERPSPVRNGLRVYATYRACDMALLLAAVVLHHTMSGTHLGMAFEHESWPAGAAHVSPSTATWVAVLFLIAAMGKSALFPLGGWLPRAMEGPTPSSALFYGALSVHGGVYLLLRSWPLFEGSLLARGLAITLGLLTAVQAALSGRVQTDAKSTLAFATTAQVGIMIAEIGMGFPRLALAHLVAHAFLRGYQLLRTPSALLDARSISAALGGAPLPQDTALERALPLSVARPLYRAALARFYADPLIDRFIVGPLGLAGRALESGEQAWVELVTRVPPSSPRDAALTPGAKEALR